MVRMPLTPATKLGPYEIIAPLGAGGMGEVYRARDTRLDRDVAVKVMPDRVAGDPLISARFEREAKVVAALSHPNVLAVYDVGRQGDVAYVVTELLEGETLRQTLMEGAVPVRRAIEIAVSVADGLAAAHARGVVHRDLKPENIFLTTDGVVKILDFGLARMEGETQPASNAAHTPTVTLNTSPGTILGTINYMSPEQIRAQKTDGRSDVFSFGCVLYEMLTGERAFQGETTVDTMTAILREAPKSVRSSRRVIGPEIERVIERCLEKKPEARFQSSHDLAFTLRSVLADSGSRVIGDDPKPAPRWGIFAAIVVAIVFVGGYLMIRNQPRGSAVESRSPIHSLAVLPLENVSRDPEQEYFVDGMTEALISDLARIGGLKVISRTSVMRYKNTAKSLPEIAKELNVEAIVEGSVQQAGERVRITAQLIHAATDEHLWSEIYDRDLRDILRLQSEVARAITQEIKVKLTPQEQARMVADRSVAPEAFQAYLKGRFHWNKRTPDGLKKAVELLEQAVALDPEWPLAYAGLADAYALMPYYSLVPPKEAMPKAKSAAAKALQLDESLAEAHASLALMATNYDWDWAIAERGFKRAIDLSPNYATAHHWYERHLLVMGRYAEAIKEITLAQTLDPLSLIINVNVGGAQLFAGDVERAESLLRQTVELGPDWAVAHRELAIALLTRGKVGEATTQAREAVRLSANDPYHAAILGLACAKAGQPEEARRILQELADRAAETYVAPSLFALVHAGLEETVPMFDWLEKAYQDRDTLLPYMLREPLLASMRAEPRFADLVRRLGLPSLPPITADPHSPSSPSRETGVARIADKKTLAVLPFVNDSGETELDYLSDGIAETLINGFSRIENLNTVPRSSAFRHKGKDVDPLQAGRTLLATAVLSGRVLKRGDNLTVQAELVDVAGGRQLWGERYQRKVVDLVEIERDIAKEITDALRLRLTGEQRDTMTRGYSHNSEAYRLYLHGRSWWSKRSKEGFDNALRMFHEAVQLDPNFALAFTGLADSYSLLPLYGWMSSKEAEVQARAAAERALQLDDSLAEAHTSMGMVWFYLNWEFDKAEAEFHRAEELNPRYATAQQWWGLCAGIRGRFTEAEAKLHRAVELDPLVPIFTHNLAWGHWWAHDWREAYETAKSGMAFAPEFFLFRQIAGLCILELGEPDQAVALLKEARDMAGNVSFANSYLAYVLGRTGNKAEVQTILDEWLEFAKWRYVPPTDLALMHLALGDRETALEWLEKGIEERDVWMSFLSVLPFWDPLRDDPRFLSILKRVGLPDLRNTRPPGDQPTKGPTP